MAFERTLRLGIPDVDRSADVDCGVCVCCGMELGELVTYKGRAYVLRGLEPMSVPERRAELEDPETGERLTVAFEEVSDPPSAGDLTRDP